MTMEGWSDWRKQYKASHPFVYWFTEEFLSSAQDFVSWPLDRWNELRVYFINRYVDQIHVLRTGFKPGEYHEVEERMLYGMFETLVDFVEGQKCHMEICFNTDSPNKPWIYKFKSFFRWTRIRNRELGVKYLQWEMTLDDPNLPETERCSPQAVAAREVYALYTWWKDIRPLRPDPYRASGFDKFSEMLTSKYGQGLWHSAKTPEEKKQQHDIFELTNKIEQQYQDEDQEMLIRLVKIRQSLWT